MRRLIAAVALAGTTGILPPAVAAPRGTIAGFVINDATGRRQPGVEVTLTAQRPDGSGRDSRTVRTDLRGRYRFDGLATGELLYAIDARYDGGLFPGRVVTLPADTAREPVITSRIRVWDTTSDPAAIVIRRDDSFALTRGSEVEVVESVTVVNRARDAYIGRGAALVGASSDATLGVALPATARRDTVAILDSEIDVPGIVPTDFGFALTVAIPPGSTALTFRYRVSGAGGTFDLSRTALYPMLELSVFAEPPLEVRSNRLNRRDDIELEGRTYGRWSTADTLDPGDPIQVLAIAQAGSSLLLVAGAAALLVVIAFAGAIAARRRTRIPRRAPVPGAAPAADVRRELLVAIANLDLEYRAGELAPDEWRARRSALKRRLEPDPTR